jgi:hypothetical protein
VGNVDIVAMLFSRSSKRIFKGAPFALSKARLGQPRRCASDAKKVDTIQDPNTKRTRFFTVVPKYTRFRYKNLRCMEIELQCQTNRSRKTIQAGEPV